MKLLRRQILRLVAGAAGVPVISRIAWAQDYPNKPVRLIVGFPAEDESAFRRTLAVVRAAGISAVHVFPYSPRPGTKTAAADAVPLETKRERSARLREASRVASLARWRQKLGREDLVLVDRVRGGEVTEEGIRAA